MVAVWFPGHPSLGNHSKFSWKRMAMINEAVWTRSRDTGREMSLVVPVSPWALEGREDSRNGGG